MRVFFKNRRVSICLVWDFVFFLESESNTLYGTLVKNRVLVPTADIQTITTISRTVSQDNSISIIHPIRFNTTRRSVINTYYFVLPAY